MVHYSNSSLRSSSSLCSSSSRSPSVVQSLLVPPPPPPPPRPPPPGGAPGRSSSPSSSSPPPPPSSPRPSRSSPRSARTLPPPSSPSSPPAPPARSSPTCSATPSQWLTTTRSCYASASSRARGATRHRRAPLEGVASTPLNKVRGICELLTSSAVSDSPPNPPATPTALERPNCPELVRKKCVYALEELSINSSLWTAIGSCLSSLTAALLEER